MGCPGVCFKDDLCQGIHLGSLLRFFEGRKTKSSPESTGNSSGFLNRKWVQMMGLGVSSSNRENPGQGIGPFCPKIFFSLWWARGSKEVPAYGQGGHQVHHIFLTLRALGFHQQAAQMSIHREFE